MKMFLDAKTKVQEWEKANYGASFRVFAEKAMEPFQSLGLDTHSLLKPLFEGSCHGKEEISLSDLRSWLTLEDTLLSIADYLCSVSSIREFDWAVKLEEIRQVHLLPLLTKNEGIAKQLMVGASPCLPRHTPKGR